MRLRISAMLAAVVPLFAQPPALETRTASIAGVVLAEASNSALAGAIVTAYRRIPQPRPYAAHGVTASDGSFTLLPLPAGTYNICVQPSGGAYLDPCTWGQALPSVAVVDGQASIGNTVKLPTGGVLKVRVNDPAGNLQAKAGDPGPGHVLMMLHPSNGPPVPLPLTKNDVTGRDYEVVIPMDTTLSLLTYSKEVTFTDPDQKPVQAGGGVRKISIPSAGPQTATVVFTVTGRP